MINSSSEEDEFPFCHGYDEFGKMLRGLTDGKKTNIRVNVDLNGMVQVFYGNKLIYRTDTYNITWLFFLMHGIVIDDENKFVEGNKNA